MQLSAQELDAASLAKLGDEARTLLSAGDIDALAARFGYALAFGRKPADAIREALASSLLEAGASRLIPTGWETPRVSYFKPNDARLFALVECLVPTENGAPILVEVIVAGSRADAHATLEQVSAAV
jgi:hypothetical protein